MRTSPLTAAEITTFYEKGYVRPGRVLDGERVEFLRELVQRLTRREEAAGRRYDLLDPALWPEAEGDETRIGPSHSGQPISGNPNADSETEGGGEPGGSRGTAGYGESGGEGAAPAGEDDAETAGPEAEAAARDPAQSFDFLFNLWLTDEDFRAAVFNPTTARWAAQLLGTTGVRLLEDNALNKSPSPHDVRWHQDYSYWPLAQPNAVTAWIALDEVTRTNGAMLMAVGSNHLGERLPVVFGTGRPYLREHRPATVVEVGDPDELGLPVEVVELAAGEVSMHSAMTWHASGPNLSDGGRRAMVIRYVADGTVWLGSQRYEYNYSDTEVGLAPGEPIGGRYFPKIPF